jgi:orotate phosphoribosyltransferase
LAGTREIIGTIYDRTNKFFSRTSNPVLSKVYLETLYLQKVSLKRQFSFVSFSELMHWTNDWVKTFPQTYDLVVGIPRSGLLVANIIALKLGLPLTTPDNFKNDRLWASKLIENRKKYQNVLLIDDSIESGNSMGTAYEFLKSCNKTVNITKGALIATKNSICLIDLFYKTVPQPRVFEWNLLHSKKGKTCSDLDGVICENCPPGIDADEEQYKKWLLHAKPYLIPDFEIDAIISCRLEKYRAQTELWLAKNGVHYKELILWDIATKADRKGNHAQHKIRWLLQIKPVLFIESSLWEAEQIFAKTKIPALCTDKMYMFS